MIDPNLRTQHHDDRLLDRIGRGDRILPPDDDVAAMLSAWRHSLPAPGSPDPRLLIAVTGPPRRQAKRRAARASVSIAASVAVLSGGVMVAAAYANPDSPLWPVTRLVYGNMAESRIALENANHAIADARTAADQGRYAEAIRLLAVAADLADKVDEPGAAARLRDEIAKVRASLPPDTRGNQGAAGRPTESLGVQPPPLDPGNGPQNTPRNSPGAANPQNGQGADNGNGPGANNGNGQGADSGNEDEGGDEGGEPPPVPENAKPHNKKVENSPGYEYPAEPAPAAPPTPAEPPATTPTPSP